MGRKWLAILGGLAAVALIVIALTLMRERLIWKPPGDAVAFAKDTQKHFRAAPSVDVENRAELVEAFSSAPVVINSAFDRNGDPRPAVESSLDLLSEQVHDALVKVVAEFLELRSRADADAYASWMRSHGYTLKSPDKLTVRQRRMFQHYAGREVAPDDSDWEIFKLAFEGELLHGRGGPTRPRKIATGSGSVEIWIGSLTTAAPIEEAFTHVMFAKMKEAARTNPPDLSGMRWHAGQGYASWGHWTPSTSYLDLIERDGVAICAQVLCVLRADSDAVTPTQIFLSYDPATRVWRIEDMAYINTYEITLGLGPVF